MYFEIKDFLFFFIFFYFLKRMFFIMGNQGSPYPSFFLLRRLHFVRRHGLLRFAPRRRSSALFLYGARFARARSAHTGFAQYIQPANSTICDSSCRALRAPPFFCAFSLLRSLRSRAKRAHMICTVHSTGEFNHMRFVL